MKASLRLHRVVALDFNYLGFTEQPPEAFLELAQKLARLLLADSVD